MKYYPPITTEDSSGKKVTERMNTYAIMFKESTFNEKEQEEIK